MFHLGTNGNQVMKHWFQEISKDYDIKNNLKQWFNSLRLYKKTRDSSEEQKKTFKKY